MSDDRDVYRAVNQRAGLSNLSARCRLRVTGPDRAKFLHNLTTNEVKRLAVGLGQEAFVTSPQGKTLGYVTLLACPEEILVRTDPGGLEQVLPHLNKYGLFDEIGLDDATPTTFELHLAGPEVEAWVSRAGGEPPPPGRLVHHEIQLGPARVRLVRESPTGRPGLTVIGRSEDAQAVISWLRERAGDLSPVEISPALFDALRIEAGTPVFGRDVTPENLPQEVDRDDRAINFVKGCYLGQETVARIDALGHVNKVLKGLKIPEGPVPSPGAELETPDGKRVGTITSSAFSPGWGFAVALGYVRVAHARPESELRLVAPGSGATAALVSDLPMLPPKVA
jgi:folate-binding protein YgfZ